MTSPPQGEVTVRLKGPETLLSHLSPDDLVPLKVDLPKQESGKYCFEYKTRELPPSFQSLQVDQIIPNCIDLTLERKVSKEVPVIADVIGTPAEGYSLGVVTVKPDKIEITGAESAVAQVFQVRTKQVYVTNAKENIKVTVPLVPFSDGSHIEYLGQAEPAAEVSISIEPQRVEKTFSAVPVYPNPPFDNEYYKLRPERIDVILYGPKPILQDMDARSLRVDVDLTVATGLVTTRHPFTISLEPSMVRQVSEEGKPGEGRLPEGVSVISFRPTSEVKLYLLKELPSSP